MVLPALASGSPFTLAPVMPSCPSAVCVLTPVVVAVAVRVVRVGASHRVAVQAGRRVILLVSDAAPPLPFLSMHKISPRIRIENVELSTRWHQHHAHPLPSLVDPLLASAPHV